MKGPAIRYLNEIVGLTVMALMIVALVAGQADATVHQSVRNDTIDAAPRLAASFEAVTESTTLRADIEIPLDPEWVDVAGARDAIGELIRVELHRE